MSIIQGVSQDLWQYIRYRLDGSIEAISNWNGRLGEVLVLRGIESVKLVKGSAVSGQELRLRNGISYTTR